MGGKGEDAASSAKALVSSRDSHGAGASCALRRLGSGLPPDLPPSLDELSIATQRSPTSCPSRSLEREGGEKEVI